MDMKLLLDLFHIPSQSGYENEVQEFICSFLEDRNIKYEVDEIEKLGVKFEKIVYEGTVNIYEDLILVFLLNYPNLRW
jgi:putative aminopeptidase FrvX